MPIFTAPRPGRAPLVLAAALAAVAGLGLGAPAARAQVTTYGTSASFQDVLAAGAYTEGFDSLRPGTSASSSLSFPAGGGGGPFGFTASVPATRPDSLLYIVVDPDTATDPLDPNTATDRALSTNLFTDPLTISFANSASPVTAFGGRFFLTLESVDFQDPTTGVVTVTARTVGGLESQVTLNYASAPASYLAAQFAGFTTTEADPLSTVTISSTTPSSYATADGVTTGARAVAAAVPEPGTAALAGLPLLVALAGAARRRRLRA